MRQGGVQALQEPQTQEALARAGLYRLLSLAFSYPDGESLAELQELCDEVKEGPLAGELELSGPLAALGAALAGAPAEVLAGEHTRLFSGQVVCSAHETEYEPDPFAKARQLADISGFYRAFGLQVARSRPGLPDFVGAELEFMAFLVVKEAYAAHRGWRQKQLLCLEAQAKFLEDHAGRWLPLFCRRLAQEGGAFYGAAAEICQRFLRAEVARLGVRPRPPVQRLALADDGEEMACGLPEEDGGATGPR